MGKIGAIFGVPAPEQATIAVRQASEFTPQVETHLFEEKLLKKLILWVSDSAPIRNMMLVGGKGTGKTSTVLQFAARLGLDVYPISCSGKTRFADLVGTLTIAKDGSTVFQDGPLTKAYRNGGIFLANEISRMDPGEQMRFVDVLDKNSTLTIPQTGETMKPHKDFRIAATGNSGGFGDESGAYAGERIGSSAFKDRFFTLEMNDISEEFKIKLVNGILGNETIAKEMVRFARDVRKNYVGAGGAFRVDISPRACLMWASLASEYRRMKGVEALEEALNDVVLNGAPAEEQEAIRKLFKFGKK